MQRTQHYVQLANRVGARVWVTEFAFYQGYNQRSVEQVGTQMQAYLSYLKSEPSVTRYAWFANRICGTEPWVNPVGWNSPLLDDTGKPTSVAAWYVP